MFFFGQNCSAVWMSQEPGVSGVFAFLHHLSKEAKTALLPRFAHTLHFRWVWPICCFQSSGICALSANTPAPTWLQCSSLLGIIAQGWPTPDNGMGGWTIGPSQELEAASQNSCTDLTNKRSDQRCGFISDWTNLTALNSTEWMDKQPDHWLDK